MTHMTDMTHMTEMIDMTATTSNSQPASPLPVLEYAYTHEQTQATTGYFSCVPPADMDFEAALARLEAAPMDDFLHLHLLRHLSTQSTDHLTALAALCYHTEKDDFVRPVLAALLLECAVLLPQHERACAAFPAHAAARLAHASPALYLRAVCRADMATATAWSELFNNNICGHHALPHPEEAGIPLLFSQEDIAEAARSMAAGAGLMAAHHARLAAEPAPAWQRPPAHETFLRAQDALMAANAIAGPEMRHEASLSPIALLRAWQVDVEVCCGAASHRLRGQATAYGRGLSLAAARASYAMEIVERASAYVSIGPASDGHGDASGRAEGWQVLNRKQPLPLLKARFSELQALGRAALDPNMLPVEAPYEDFPLYWLPATGSDGNEVLVPAQAVFLFCNLDEQALFLAGGSTGLASGNTLEEARQAALTEIFERDAEATTPYSRSRCFTLRSRDALLQSLLDDYAACGINVQFQDITTEFGLPVYQCFVMGRDGTLVRATGAGLSGPRAALAALTETPWPYSTSQSVRPKPSGPGLAGLPVRMLEDLPDYSLPSPADNCRLLEAVLCDHGRSPLYVDISRRDFDLPVVRALVPGLALTGEWDRFSRPDKRIFARYASLFA